MTKTISVTRLALAAGLSALPAFAADSMLEGLSGFSPSAPLLTIGQTLVGTSGALNPSTAGDYVPVGVLDGLGAYALDAATVRVFASHELGQGAGNAYSVSDGLGGSFTLLGARVSYFDVDRTSRTIVDAGLAYDAIYTADGQRATDASFLLPGFSGFSRFCSSQLVEAGEYGLVDTIYFANEEDGFPFNTVGGAVWALDASSGSLWQVAAFGHGAWENVTALATGDDATVAFLLADDSSPFDADADGQDEAAPLYLYVGTKDAGGDFLGRNGLVDGQLFVFVSDGGELTPLDFAGSGSLAGTWVPVSNAQQPALASLDGSTGFDRYGFPTQRNLWTQAEALGTFGFSRPEDLSTNPFDGSEAVLASTGVDTYAVDPSSGDGADTFGTLYTIKTNFESLAARLTIIYDGDADPTRALRSPDNLEWSADGAIYVQEDKAETDTLGTLELLFGPGAVNPNEAGIVRVDPVTGATLRVANVDRDVVLDASIAVPGDAVDVDAGIVGSWESSGILDVSALFGQAAGTLFLLDVQAHGIDDQAGFNPTSRITDGDLVEGGQLLFLQVLAGDDFVDLGNALGGTLGAPLLEASGSLAPNLPLTLTLGNALPNTTSTLVIGFSALNAAFKGGVLVPDADILVPGLSTGVDGLVAISGSLPVGLLPSGATLYFQHWVADAGGPLGFAASNALSATAP